MAEPIRAYLFDSVCDPERSYHEPIEAVRGIKLMGDFANWNDLRDWFRHTPSDIVIVNLDDGGTALKVVQHLAQLAPGCGIIGVSANPDPTSIIAAMRAGCNQFVCWPIEPADLTEAVDRVRTSWQAVQHQAKRVCVIGASGGVGTTSIACSLAVELAHLTEQKCALVDLHLEFGDIGCLFDCTPRYTVADVCKDGVEADRLVIANAIHELPSNVAVLTRPESLTEAREVTPEGVQNTLRVLSEMYPFVVVDVPRNFSFIRTSAISETDHILIVAQLSVPNIRNASRIYTSLREMGVDEDRVEIVLNRCKAHYERITPDEVEAHFRREIFAMIPNDYRRVQTSLDLGEPVATDTRSNPFRAAMQQMAKKLASGHLSQERLDNLEPAGLLSKLWKRPAKVRAAP